MQSVHCNHHRYNLNAMNDIKHDTVISEAMKIHNTISRSSKLCALLEPPILARKNNVQAIYRIVKYVHTHQQNISK